MPRSHIVGQMTKDFMRNMGSAWRCGGSKRGTLNRIKKNLMIELKQCVA
jgi:hypothetical protein